MIIHSNIQKALEFEWNGFEEITLFTSSKNLNELKLIYQKEFNIYNQTNENGKLELYYPNEENPVFSLLVVEVKESEAVEELQTYIGSTVLDDLVTKTYDGLIGVYFKHQQSKH